MLYVKDICHNCYIFISEMKNNDRYDIKIVHRYNIDILILIRISLHETQEELAWISISTE